MTPTKTAPKTRGRRARATVAEAAAPLAEAQVWVFTHRLGREGTMVAGVRRFEGDVCDQETLDQVGPAKTYRWKMQDLIRQVPVSAVVAPDERELERRAAIEAAIAEDNERRARAEADERERQRAAELDALVATGSVRLTADLRWCDGQIEALQARRALIVEALAAPGVQPAGRR